MSDEHLLMELYEEWYGKPQFDEKGRMAEQIVMDEWDVETMGERPKNIRFNRVPKDDPSLNGKAPATEREIADEFFRWKKEDFKKTPEEKLGEQMAHIYEYVSEAHHLARSFVSNLREPDVIPYTAEELYKALKKIGGTLEMASFFLSSYVPKDEYIKIRNKIRNKGIDIAAEEEYDLVDGSELFDL